MTLINKREVEAMIKVLKEESVTTKGLWLMFDLDSGEERIDQLKYFKEKHRHLRVIPSVDKSLASFCCHMRKTRREEVGPKSRGMDDEKIQALDDIGFPWDIGYDRDQHISFEERIDQLKDLKEKHRHLRVIPSVDKSLASFFCRMRKTRREESPKSRGTDKKIQALDDIGFPWDIGYDRDQHISFEERIEFQIGIDIGEVHIFKPFRTITASMIDAIVDSNQYIRSRRLKSLCIDARKSFKKMHTT